MIGPMRRIACWLAVALVAACSPEPTADRLPEDGEVVTPPFEVAGDATGLLLVWFDDEGTHTATSREEIPEDRRAHVRVDDLRLAPEDRLDPELVWVADLRRPGEGGAYTVRRMPRASFDRRVEAATEVELADVEEPLVHPVAPEGADDADVVIYGASWCHACRSAAAFLRQRNVPFVERDVEREPGAREAMQEATQAAGVRPRGIPVIDFRGEIIAGFDRARLEAAIERTRTPI